MRSISNSNMNKLIYGIKKIFLYLVFGVIAASFPGFIFSMIIGFPAIAITALFLAIYDVVILEDKPIPPINIRLVLKLLLAEIIFMVFVLSIFILAH